MNEHESQGQETTMQSDTERMAAFESRLSTLEARERAQASEPVTQPSGDYTHTGIELVGRHVPETHEEVVGMHQRRDVELPGEYHIGALIEGAFIPLARLKAAEVLEAVERAQQSEPERDDSLE
jgi:hypothetical protein